MEQNSIGPDPADAKSTDSALPVSKPGDVNLAGMDAAKAKEYILGFITTLKLTEKEITALEDVAAKWKSRIELARFKGKDELLVEAEKEAEKVNAKLAALREEERTLRGNIAAMQRQVPGLAARERSVDPDLLEQEFLMALGRSGEEAETRRAFAKMEKDGSADAALEELKAKMKNSTP